MRDSRFYQLTSIYTWRMSTAFIFCTIFAALLIWVVLVVEDQTAEGKFKDNAEAVYSQLLHQLNASKSVISALSGWQHSQVREQLSDLRIFSQEVLGHFPHIHSIQYVKKIMDNERNEFEEKMRESGYATYSVTQLNQDFQFKTRQTAEYYYPTIFIEPLNPETAGTIGFDILSNPALKHSIDIAIETGKEVMSPPINIFGQGKGVMILKATYKGKVVPADKKSRIDQVSGLFVVSIVAADFLPIILSVLNGQAANVSLWNNNLGVHSGQLFNYSIQENGKYGLTNWLPTFNFNLGLAHAGQPITFQMWRKANLNDYSFKFPIIIFVLYVIVLLLIRMSLKGDLQHSIASEIAQDEIFKEKELAELTLHSIADGVVTADEKNNIDYMNDVAEKLIGMRKEDAKGKPLNEVFEIYSEKTPQTTILLFNKENIYNDIAELPENYLLKRDGETEYSIKISASRIRNRNREIVGTIIVFRNVTSERKMAQLMAHQARHDQLTGLYNRREFELQLTRSLERAKKVGESDVLCYLDLDQFKVVNDTCGHVAGDKLLTQVTHILHNNIRDSDILARLGGDEFGLIIKNCSIEKAIEISTFLHNAIKEFHFSWEGKIFTVSSSMGLVKISPEIGSITEVLSAADSACYMAKDKGRNRIYAHTYNDQELISRQGEMQWVHKINEAFENKRFRLYRQVVKPLLNYNNPIHYEVLIRMIDGNGSVLLPMAFIPAAERYNIMISIDRWVIKTAFSFIARERNTSLVYNINLSGKSINEDGFLEFIIAQLKLYDIQASAICFEITETAAISNLNTATDFMNTLKEHGCTFALDDFGSGLSSFSYLKNLPVDFIKIDGSFVKDLMDDPIDRAMVSSIAQVGRVMKIKTIAEFVENNAIKNQLATMDVDYVQGNGVAKPELWNM